MEVSLKSYSLYGGLAMPFEVAKGNFCVCKGGIICKRQDILVRKPQLSVSTSLIEKAGSTCILLKLTGLYNIAFQA